jgi:hypothetical protein
MSIFGSPGTNSYSASNYNAESEMERRNTRQIYGKEFDELVIRVRELERKLDYAGEISVQKLEVDRV